MPKSVEDCVEALMGDPKFKPRKKGQSKKNAAYAVCTAQHEESKKESKKSLGAEEPRVTHCICTECGHQEVRKATLCQDTSHCGQPMIAKERKSFPMHITKATMREGQMYFQAAVSDNEWDAQEERLALSIFNDFKSRIDEGKKKDDYLPPFISLSHYNRMEDRSGEQGIIKDVWTQGAYFKVDGYFHNTRLGKRAFGVARSELKRLKAGEEISDPVRLSIGFYPKRITREDGRVVYLQGELDHVALTRLPVNPRTGFTYLTEKSMATKKEDALSIVGEDYADDVEELESKQRAEKADVTDMVVKTEVDIDEEQDLVLRALLQGLDLDEDAIEEKAWSYAQKRSLPNSAYAWVEKGPGCEKDDGKTPQKCRHLPYKGASGKVDCPHVRAALQAIGGARTGKKMSVPSGVKGKLQRALKSCQKGKSEILETELPEYQQGRINGFNDALDMMVAETATAETVTPKEVKSNMTKINPEAIKLEETPEVKSEAHPVDQFAARLKAVLSDEEAGRSDKVAQAQTLLQSIAAYSQKEINETTPLSPEDVAESLKAQVEEAIKPISDKLAVLEESIKAGPEAREAPESKALKPTEKFAITPLESLKAAQGIEADEMPRSRQLARASVGLVDNQL